MTRAEREECLHAIRVEAWALALFDDRPRGLSSELEASAMQRYRAAAEQKVSEYERSGVFATYIGRVA